MIIAFQIPEELNSELEAYSRRIERTKSQVLRIVVKKFLEAEKNATTA